MSTQKNIIQHLVNRDRRLKSVIQLCPYPKSRKNPDIYMSLLSSIVSQQLSVKAADTIFNRFLDLYPDRYPQPKQLRRTPVSRLRAAGLSQQKAQYLKNVAAFSLEDDGLDYQWLDLSSRTAEGATIDCRFGSQKTNAKSSSTQHGDAEFLSVR